MAQVLIIEDDPNIRAALTRALNAMPHVATAAANAMEGLRLTIDTKPDVVLLDLGLPDLDGHSLLAMMRAISDVPVIIVSARDDDRSVVNLLNAGADDYLVKPFTPAQLDARIRAVLRRSQQAQRATPTVVGDLHIDVGGRRATLGGEVLDLSPKEFDLLAYLAENVGLVISKRVLVAEVWNMPYGGSEKTVDVHLHWLRRKLGETADEPRYIHRVRGVGIKMVDPNE